MKRNKKPLNASAERVLAEGLRRGDADNRIQRDVRLRTGARVKLDEIKHRREKNRRLVETKQYLKRKGADLVAEFLEKARGGGDPSDLQTVLTNAVYLDLLRRYAAEEEPLDGIGMKELLKLSNDYWKMRIASRGAAGAGGAGLPASRALELVEEIGGAMAAEPALKKAFEPMREKLADAVRLCYGAEEYESARVDQAKLQELAEKYEEAEGGAANG